MAPEAPVHPSRREIVPKPAKKRKQSTTQPSLHQRKKRKQNPFEGRGTARPKKHSVASRKTYIRDLRRQLQKVDSLPADVRVAKERELAACERELEEEVREKERQEMIGRYHMVRFFDRRKAERRLKKARRGLKEVEEKSEEGGVPGKETAIYKNMVREAETMLNYAIYYPLMLKYESLFPSKKGNDEEGAEDEDALRKGNEEIWGQIKVAMEKGQAALDALREWMPRKVEKDDAALEKLESKFNSKAVKANGASDHKSRKSTARPAAEQDEEEDEESDGGFFE